MRTVKDFDLAELALFSAVAEQRSFRAAARLRGESPSKVSAGVRQLEARLGVRLLNRTTRSVTLTEAGAELLAALRPALGEIDRALDSVNRFRTSPRGTLKLNVPGAVADLILPSILAGFLAEHPDIQVEITADDRFIDVLAAGFDAGIRYDERLEQDMVAVPIGPRQDRFVTAAAPAYLAAHGTPRHPSELTRHQSLRFRFASGVLSPWEYEKGGETLFVSPPARFIGSRVGLVLAMAEAGLGLCAIFERYLAPSIARGALVPVLEDWSVHFPGPFLYFAERRLMPAPLRAFVDYLRRHPE